MSNPTYLKKYVIHCFLRYTEIGLKLTYTYKCFEKMKTYFPSPRVRKVDIQ